MISFIVIGKNEEKTIQNTLNSVLNAVSNCAIEEYEIIYVDSKSDDQSIDIVCDFLGVKIFQIAGEINAAIARNVGANEALGDILCFLDADMELYPNFLELAINQGRLVYPFMSGQLRNIFYDQNWNIIDENLLYPQLRDDDYFTTTGGFFIIENALWRHVGGMKSKYDRSQDVDLGLRLSKLNVKLLRKKDLFVDHHTIHYQHKSRMWKMLLNGSLLYNTCVLYRDHITNKHIYPLIIRNNYSLIFLIISLFILPLTGCCLVMYPFIQIARIYLHKRKISFYDYINHFFYYILNDLFIIYGFFFFWPKEKEIIYTELKCD